MIPLKTIVLLLGTAGLAKADFSNDGVPVAPDVLTRIVAGAERSGDPLQSKATEDESTVFYLRRAEYIGECQAPFGTVHVANPELVEDALRKNPPIGHELLPNKSFEFKVSGENKLKK